MNWLSTIFSSGASKVVDSVSKGLDNLFTSDEERLKARNLLQQAMNEYSSEMQDKVNEQMKLQVDVIKTEANGESYLQRNWRPITMLTFVFIIANTYIIAPYMATLFSVSLITPELTSDMWGLLKLGIGGYVAGRSIEKSIKVYKEGKQ